MDQRAAPRGHGVSQDVGFHVLIEDVRQTIEGCQTKIEDVTLGRKSAIKALTDISEVLPTVLRRMNQIEVRLDTLG